MPWGIDIDEAPCSAPPGEPLPPLRARVISFGTTPGSAQTETRANGQATVSLVSGPPGAVLRGTLVRNVTSGVVEFDDLEIDREGIVRLAVSAELGGLDVGAQYLPIDEHVLEQYRFHEPTAALKAFDELAGPGLNQFGSPPVSQGLVGGARRTGQAAYFDRATGNTQIFNALDVEFTADVLVYVDRDEINGNPQHVFNVGTWQNPSQYVFGIIVMNDGRLRYAVRTGDAAEGNTYNWLETDPGVFTFREWHLITVSRRAIAPYVNAASRGDSEIQIYLDGVLVKQGNVFMPRRRANARVMVGRWESGTQWMIGLMNEIRLSKTIRTATETLEAARGMGLA